MTTLPIAKVACVFSAFCFAAAIASPAQTFSNLFNFDGPDGSFPTVDPRPRHRRELLWDDKRWLWHSIQNVLGGYADDALQLLRPN